ncbi:MAG: T9SS type A sorting domain-containing protein, partial [Rhodothermales bacterium]|nr:T9SS type A sorting domain-containing protein [Rhodothermales bacterium]
LIVGTHPSSHATVTVDAGALLIASQVSVNGNVNGTITVGSAPPKTVSAGIHADTLWIGPQAGFERDSLLVLAGGVVGGTGSFPGDYRNETVIAPGYGPHAVGTFTIDGAYHQTTSGALAIELGGQSESDYDRLVAADSAVIDGRLSVRRVGGFAPRVGDVFEILQAEKLVGEFASIEITGFKADVVYNEASVQLHITSGVSIEPSEKPTQHFSLHQNFPNPFNPVTTIAFDLPERSTVRLSLYDILGREVRVLDAGDRSAGRHQIILDAHGLPSGSYYYRIDAGGFAATRPLIIVK